MREPISTRSITPASLSPLAEQPGERSVHRVGQIATSRRSPGNAPFFSGKTSATEWRPQQENLSSRAEGNRSDPTGCLAAGHGPPQVAFPVVLQLEPSELPL